MELLSNKNQVRNSINHMQAVKSRDAIVKEINNLVTHSNIFTAKLIERGI